MRPDVALIDCPEECAPALVQAAWRDFDCGEEQVKLYVSYLRRSFAAGCDQVIVDVG